MALRSRGSSQTGASYRVRNPLLAMDTIELLTNRLDVRPIDSRYYRQARGDAENTRGRLPAGHARNAHPENAQPRAQPWMGNRAPYPAGIGRRAQDRRRVALSGAAASAVERIRGSRMGDHREQPAGALLPDHARGQEKA